MGRQAGNQDMGRQAGNQSGDQAVVLSGNRGRGRRGIFYAVAFGAALAVAGCAPSFKNHGYIPPQDQLDEITVGSDTRETVAAKIGVPSSGGVLESSGYYYVRMRTKTIGPLAAREIDRQVLAISFSPGGVVQNIERFGLEKGQVVPLQRRVTSSPVSDKSFIRQLLGNLGRFNPAGLGG